MKAKSTKSAGATGTKKTSLTKTQGGLTTVAARIDVGLGNQLYIRGQGNGLSWDQGQPMKCLGASTWVWSAKADGGKVVFKLLLNDQRWALGQDVLVEPGTSIEVAPEF